MGAGGPLSDTQTKAPMQAAEVVLKRSARERRRAARIGTSQPWRAPSTAYGATQYRLDVQW